MLAVIPARAGSKGLPGKNLRDLCGRPLIEYTIEAVMQSQIFSKVLVSTDSEEIAQISKKMGAEAPFLRPAHLSSDTALARDVYLHALEHCAQNNFRPENFGVFLPTSPLREVTDILRAFELFQEKKADSVLSMTENLKPISWLKEVDGKSMQISSIGLAKDSALNRQNEQKLFLPNGAIYFFKTSFFYQSESYYSSKSYAYLMPAQKSIDIDTFVDFELAEIMMRKYQ